MDEREARAKIQQMGIPEKIAKLSKPGMEHVEEYIEKTEPEEQPPTEGKPPSEK